MANGNDFKGGSPWGSPPGGGNGSRRGGQRPPNIDEVVEKIQKFQKYYHHVILSILIFMIKHLFKGLVRK